LPAEIENQLMDHAYFGIRNILALRGDPPQGVPEWQARADSYNYAYQLIEQIARLNRGEYLERAGFKTEARAATDFTIGAAVYPDHPDPKERLEFFRRKVDAGAEFAITQMLFDADAYARFLDACDAAGLKRIPVLPGTRILRSRAQAMRMAERFQVAVSPDYANQLPEREGPDTAEQALEAFYGFVRRLQALGAPGLHLFVLNDTALGARALRELK
jgi:methylenetetrahydrofolate reductase (NADPH)